MEGVVGQPIKSVGSGLAQCRESASIRPTTLKVSLGLGVLGSGDGKLFVQRRSLVFWISTHVMSWHCIPKIMCCDRIWEFQHLPGSPIQTRKFR